MTEYNGYKIVRDKATNLLMVKAIGKGSAPKELRGSYTNERAAREAIDASKLTREVKKDAKTNSTS